MNKYTYEVIEAKDMALKETRYILQITMHYFDGANVDPQYVIFSTQEDAEKFGKLFVEMLSDAEREIEKLVDEVMKKANDE